MIFKELTAIQTIEFHEWARENDTEEHRANADIYHPAIREEWARMDEEVS